MQLEMMPGMPERQNLHTADFEFDDADPPGYHSGVARVGALSGGSELAVKLFEIPAGESLCPYHYEYVEEWLIVLQGGVELRTPGGTEPLRSGDIVRFPSGPEGAHKVTNRTSESARVLMFSSAHEPSVAIYPDSGKVGVWTPGGLDNLMFRRTDGEVDYFDGES
jgi:uncharacterized cupin superfamily protein